MEDETSAAPEVALDPREIDAFWLQRKIATFETDPLASQNLAEKVFAALQGADPRYIENELVFILDYERFDFVKLLMNNRKKSKFIFNLTLGPLLILIYLFSYFLYAIGQSSK
jgi:pre-mRNA-splicing helicase BRR2